MVSRWEPARPADALRPGPPPVTEVTSRASVWYCRSVVATGSAIVVTTKGFVAVTDEAGNSIDVKAQIEELNADVDAMLAAQAAEQAAAQPAGDIEVSDLSIDVAGTIESDEAEVIGEIVEEIAAEAEVVEEAEEIKDSEA